MNNDIMMKLRLMGKVEYKYFYNYLNSLNDDEFKELYIELSIRLERRAKYFSAMMLVFLVSIVYWLTNTFNTLLGNINLSKLNVTTEKQMMILISYFILIIIILFGGTYLAFSAHLNTKRKLLIMDQFKEDKRKIEE